jgi:hypothetical protein
MGDYTWQRFKCFVKNRSEGTSYNLGNTVQNAFNNLNSSFNMDMLYKYLGIGTKGRGLRLE